MDQSYMYLVNLINPLPLQKSNKYVDKVSLAMSITLTNSSVQVFTVLFTNNCDQLNIYDEHIVIIL